MRYVRYSIIIFTIVVIIGLLYLHNKKQQSINTQPTHVINQNPLSIEFMRQQTYPGSNLIIEKTLNPGNNYTQYIASYQS
jgi:hypothetical protein